MLDHKDCWETPKWLFDELYSEFGFDIDLCANEFNNKAPCYYTNYLTNSGPYFTNGAGSISNYTHENWKVGFMNPPYSTITPFIEKAIEDMKKGKTIVAVLPAETSSTWWSLVWDRKNHKPRKVRVELGDKGISIVSSIEMRFLPYKDHHPIRLYFEDQGQPQIEPYPHHVVVIVMRGNAGK